MRPDQTLVSFWIGINDISDSKNYAVNFPAFYDELMTTLFQAVESVYDLGYHNFLIMNLPPSDRNPGQPPVPNNTTMKVNWYDAALANHSNIFATAHPDARVLQFDANTFLNGVMDDAASYGITNTTGYCPAYNQPNILTDPASYGCAPQDQYFW